MLQPSRMRQTARETCILAAFGALAKTVLRTVGPCSRVTFPIFSHLGHVRLDLCDTVRDAACRTVVCGCLRAWGGSSRQGPYAQGRSEAVIVLHTAGRRVSATYS